MPAWVRRQLVVCALWAIPGVIHGIRMLLAEHHDVELVGEAGKQAVSR